MKGVCHCVPKLINCVLISWLFGGFIEDRLGIIGWELPGIMFCVVFAVCAYISLGHKSIIRWIAGGMFISLPILAMLYLAFYCCDFDTNPLAWGKMFRIICAFIAGVAFIFGGKIM